MKNLKKMRNKYQMSQMQLANFLHITQQSVWKYENDLAHPDIDTLKALAKLFHTTIDYLVADSEEDASGEEADCPDSIAPLERRLLYAFRSLGEKDQKALLQVAESLAGKSFEQ